MRTRSRILMLSLMGFVFCAPIFASPLIEFSPYGDNAGGWSYDGNGILSYPQDILVSRVLGSGVDSLVGANVVLPDLAVSGIPGGPYTVTPLDLVKIEDSGGTLLMSGVLGNGTLFPIGTTSFVYPEFQIDITSIVVTADGVAMGSAALNALTGGAPLNMDITQNGPSYGFKNMLDGGSSDSGTISGSMSIVPEPATLLLIACGGVFLRIRKR